LPASAGPNRTVGNMGGNVHNSGQLIESVEVLGKGRGCGRQPNRGRPTDQMRRFLRIAVRHRCLRCDDANAVLVLVHGDVGDPGWGPGAIDDVAITNHQIMHEGPLAPTALYSATLGSTWLVAPKEAMSGGLVRANEGAFHLDTRVEVGHQCQVPRIVGMFVDSSQICARHHEDDIAGV